MTRASLNYPQPLNYPESTSFFEAPPGDDPSWQPRCAETPASEDIVSIVELSHELRTAAMTMTSYAQALLEGRCGSSDDRSHLEGIVSSGSHLLELLDSMLAPPQHEPPQGCSPGRVVSQVVTSFGPAAEAKGIALEAFVEHDLPPWVAVDPVLVRRILTNLVSNAIKYSERGTISLRVTLESMRDDGKPLDPVMRIEVRDQGIGMTEEEIKHLAEPRYRGAQARQRQIEGSGLGLAITCGLIEQLGGQLAVASEFGQGSVFRVRLPLRDEGLEGCVPGRGMDAAWQRLPLPTLGGKVLLVEDNPHHRVLVGSSLRQAGLEVELAADGEEALALDLFQFDAVIVDQYMPRLDGSQTAQRMRARGYCGPILSLTADCRPQQQALDAPFTHTLCKTSSRAALVQALATLLPDAQAGGEAPPPISNATAAASRSDAQLKQLRVRYVRSLSSSVREMRTASECCDRAALRALAHRMMGSAGLYGFPELGEAARELYSAAEHAAREHLDLHLGRIASRVESIRHTHGH